ncbi:hypothetical protein J2782_002744 [Brucella pseudogrignonensis]|uniref:Uncharacterized protein n=1 Tax=Brucella pseudogrignonensis TaxID=419475 RepID=A0ABU1MAB8_9HYPH|nr:hypothetical protein [Brucella pseudogrignonensis]
MFILIRRVMGAPDRIYASLHMTVSEILSLLSSFNYPALIGVQTQIPIKGPGMARYLI